MSAPGLTSSWSPLRITAFRWLWLAGLGSNIGTWIHEVGAGWLMVKLSDEPLWVSLVQAAGSLPILILALPAGALADVVDRRRMLMTAQFGMLLLAAALAILTYSGSMTPHVLILLTLGIGAGAALSNPAWQTIMTELVPREQIPQASALNSVSLNLSRAVGPAIGGLIVSLFSPAAAFALNAVSFLCIIVTLSQWKPQQHTTAVPAERFVGALKAGVRYVRFSAPIRAVLVRTACFALFATSLWALMPLIAKEQLGTGAPGYGIMLGCLGAGAVLTTFILPKLRARFSPNFLVAGATLLYAGVLVCFVGVKMPLLAYALLLLAGGCWVTCVVCLNVSAMSGTPLWVRARALACYLATFYGSMAIGSPVWGYLAGKAGIPVAMLASAAGLCLGLITLVWFRLHVVPGEDLDRSTHWETPVAVHEVRPEDGPVVVTVEYRIAPARAAEFQAAMAPVAGTRYRDGAISWFLSRDIEQPDRWLEIFIVESWAEHLRQHDRVTVADRRVQVFANSFHQGPGRPIVSHMIAAPVEPSTTAGDQTLVPREGCA